MEPPRRYLLAIVFKKYISTDVMVVVVVVVGVIRDARLTLTTFNKQANIFLTGSSRETASNSRRELLISPRDGGLKFKRDPYGGREGVISMSF